ncbi:MAG: class I SAM-dependent methyltransferase, partial [Bacteroidota bacterium]
PSEYNAFQAPTSRPDHDRIYPFGVVKGRMAWSRLIDISKDFNILDIGCGSGKLMSFLKDKYLVDVEGIEPSAEAVEVGRTVGLDIKHGVLETVVLSKKYDLIYLIHVIEHLPDPTGTLKRINELLEPGGRIVICTPNHSNPERKWFGQYWDGWDTPRHIYVFNPKSLKALLEATGFKDITVNYEVYSLFNRSSNNKKKERKGVIKLHRMLEKLISYILAFMRTSGAMQVIATKG